MDGLHEVLCGTFSRDMDIMRDAFNFPENDDAVFHAAKCAGFDICAIFIDGMANSDMGGEFCLRAAFDTYENPAREGRFDFVKNRVAEVAQISEEYRVDKIRSQVMSGMCVLIIDGCERALLMDTRGFVKRPVGKTTNESVVMGSQEGFVEDLRTNITLLRRYYQSANLIAEKSTVGNDAPLRVAIVYVKGVTNAAALDEVRKRIKNTDAERVFGLGQIEQLIEDSPMSLAPQMLLTERPDRAAAALAEGQFAVLADASPYALIAPCTLFTLLQTSDDAFSRWQYGSYMRIVRFIGLALALLLPGLYVALTMYHTHVIPMSLVTAIAESRANVPFPIFVEVIIMEISFMLINEANTRIPKQVGSAVGIIGALVLGQAAVDASIISPILIIIIALAGLGCYAMPNYEFAMSVIIYRLVIVISAAVLGLFGMCVALTAMACHLCSIRSFGVGFLSPVAPWRRHNADILMRAPAKYQKIGMLFRGRRAE